MDADLCFGIVPDEHGHPIAVFADLEDAINWATAALGSGRFVIRRASPRELAAAPPYQRGGRNQQ
jgi:hypothetical protein